MRPLLDKFNELSELLIRHRDRLAQGTGVPFVRLIYRPDEERECRRLTSVLRERLATAGLSSDEIRCSELPFKYYVQKGQLELRLKTAEAAPRQATDEMGRRAEALLLDEILSCASRARPYGNLILSETGLLYPFVRLAGVLEGCENKVNIPLVILYPAIITDDKMLFMGRRETGYYRTRDLK
ncbi:MAG TPA: BREX protein BrxB domain-containing protein [Anaerolineae bacterium]|nr:BREX protein BrxB domain-containing protein [Anaerolineae bacterium]